MGAANEKGREKSKGGSREGQGKEDKRVGVHVFVWWGGGEGVMNKERTIHQGSKISNWARDRKPRRHLKSSRHVQIVDIKCLTEKNGDQNKLLYKRSYDIMGRANNPIRIGFQELIPQNELQLYIV